MKRNIKKTLSDRVITSKTKTNQFYCIICNYSSNELYIVNGESYCTKCTPTKDLPKYNQNQERIDG